MAVAIPILGLVLAAGSAVMSYTQAQDAADAQEAAQDEYNTRMREETLQKTKDINAAKANELENVSKDKLQSDLDFLEAKSSSRNVGGAIGARGQSFDLLMQGLDQTKEQQNIDITMGSRENIKQLDRQSENVLRGGVNALDNRAISRPSIATGAASAAIAGYKGFSAGQAARKSFNEWR
jgi:hypothetical protein